MVVLGGVAVSYERGTLAQVDSGAVMAALALRVRRPGFELLHHVGQSLKSTFHCNPPGPYSKHIPISKTIPSGGKRGFL